MTPLEKYCNAQASLDENAGEYANFLEKKPENYWRFHRFFMRMRIFERNLEKGYFPFTLICIVTTI